MGLNAQTTVPTFVAAQVLTAEQQNQSAGTGVPVFATTVTRDAAFGGAGEKTLAEGQLCYLEDSNVVQYYDGAAWATVGPSAPSGLTLISATTIGTSVATTTVSSAFSATYDVYKITVSGGVLASTGNIGIKFGATATGYYFGANRVQYAGADSSFAQSNGTSFARVGNGNTAGLNASFDVVNPFLTANTVVTGGFADLSTGNESYVFAGYLNNTTSYTAFDLTYTANATGGTIRVYGYKN